MISTVKAVTFIKVMSSGRTRPCLMLCEDHEGNQIETVVKLRVGKESTTTGLVCELMGSLLADDLDLMKRGAEGAPLSELEQVLPSLSERNVQRLLTELRKEGRIVLKGKKRWAKWIIAESKTHD